MQLTVSRFERVDILNRITSRAKNAFREKFRSKTHPVRPLPHGSAQKFVWTARNSFGEQNIHFFFVLLVLRIVFEADVLFTFVGCGFIAVFIRKVPCMGFVLHTV